MAGAEARSVRQRLSGATVLLTGATGFVGKAVLMTCLRELDSATRIVLVLRAPDDPAARLRAESEMWSDERIRAYAAPAAERLADGTLVALAGDVTMDDLGRSDLEPLADVTTVIHCAASVAFDWPLDEMLELDALGIVRLLRTVRKAGADPAVVHVSSAFAAGKTTGVTLERPSGALGFEPAVDLEAELAVARAWRSEIEGESRLPQHERRFAREATADVGPAGSFAVAERAERLRHDWVREQLKLRGRDRSRALGWQDTYALSKALAERGIVAEQPRALTIVRPSVILSSLTWPVPGWLEGLKNADPVVLTYASGQIPAFPGSPSGRFDVIPVDLVANACVVAAAHEPPPGEPRVVAVVSGTSNPVTFGDFAEATEQYFRRYPLPGEDGLPVHAPPLKVVDNDHLTTALRLATNVTRRLPAALLRLPLPIDRWQLRAHKQRRRFERLSMLANLYEPNAKLDLRFDDRCARELAGELHGEDRERFDFDASSVDWPSFFAEVHLPAVRRLVTKNPRRGARLAVASQDGFDGARGAVAFFDVDGVVIRGTVVHAMRWLQTREQPAADAAVWTALAALRVPGWLLADRRSRARFNREFYRSYRGLPVAEIREQAAEVLSEFILPRIQQAAVRRIRFHRNRGDHVVLLTGALDFFVEPLCHLADQLICAHLVERKGAFTGELAEPPLTAEGRVGVAAGIAAERGVALGECHAYADSVADLSLLRSVGHPHAVNPEFRLEIEARRRRWPILRWEVEGTRAAPPLEVRA